MGRLQIKYGKRYFPTLEAEVLYIGNHPTGYSGLQHAVLALEVEQAADLIEAGYKVILAEEGKLFLGEILKEPLLYLVVDVPPVFKTDTLAWYRIEQRLNGYTRATLELVAQPWETIDGKSGIRLYLETLTWIETKDERTGFEVLKDIERNGLNATNDYETYVQGQRDACMPVMSRAQWLQRMGLLDRPTPREYANRNNRRRSHWNLGDPVVVSGVQYQVGHIQDTGSMWTLRLDRKYAESVYLRVPK